MSSIEMIIDSFITEQKLDPKIKLPMIDCYQLCISTAAKLLISEIPTETETKTKAVKVLKADKIEDPSTVQSLEELRNCTTGILNQFCKDNFLKVGGNKKEIMDRVWRHLQGSGSDEDKSSRSKPKKEKKKDEKHECSGCNAKGAPCAVNGTEQHGQYWFCWRHITEADQFLNKKVAATSSSAKEEAVTSKKSVKKMVKQIEEPELETETEEEASEAEE